MSRRSRREAAKRQTAQQRPRRWIARGRAASPVPREGWLSRLVDRLVPGVFIVGFAAMFGGVAVAAGWGAISEFDHNRHLGASAVLAEATVVQVQHSGHSRYTGQPHGNVVVEFNAGGRQVRAKVSFHYWLLEPPPAVGDLALVRYDPDHPERYVRDDRVTPSTFNAVMLGMISLVVLVGTIVSLRRILSD